MAKRANKRARMRRGRPSVHDEAWSKVSVVLFDRQVRQLDDLVSMIRKDSRFSFNRTTIIRALIEGLMQSRLDVRMTRTEAELVATIANRLGRA